MYRLIVGGNNVKIQDDSGPHGMFRAWSQDHDYVSGTDYGYSPSLDVQILYNKQTQEYTAPETVYTTSRTIANGSKGLDWTFPVDSGFYYLLRFHLCEIQLEITQQNQRVFTISVDGQIEDIQVDVIRLAGGRHIPIFRDYVAWVPSDDGRRRKRGMHLSLYPNIESRPMYSNALLNGLEIFKISDSSKSLAAANLEFGSSPPAAVEVNSPEKNNKGSALIYEVVGSVIGVLVVLTALGFLILRWLQRVKDLGTNGTTKFSLGPLSTDLRLTKRSKTGSVISLPSDLCRHFLLDEIKSATGNFDHNFIIGKGGFGDVYRGYIDNGSTAVVIKRLNSSSRQGAREFLTEIEISKLRHRHLVSLIGYCDESGEMILVYDYMANGTLRSHLYNSKHSPMSWKQRLQICIGAAKGLHYLHTGAKHSIIHRDVKSTNILLDEKWVAKVSNFGLSKVGPAGGAHSHVSTLVKGTFGYVDPEYYRRQQLTDKSDVYSFGVVLLEVLCARSAVLIDLPREQVNLAEWGKLCFKKGKIEHIIDPNIKGKIAPECLSKFIETAILCLKDKESERPTMSDVSWSLEFAMQLQEAAMKRAVDEAEETVGVFPSPETADFPFLKPNTTNDDEEMLSVSTETVSISKNSGLSTSISDKYKAARDVFTDLFNPIGR